MCIDRDVEGAGGQPDEGQERHEGWNGSRESRQGGSRTERNEHDRHETGADPVGEASRNEHRGQGGKRHEEEGKTELRFARSGRVLDARQARRPCTPEESERREGARQPFRLRQSCRYRSTRLCSWSLRSPSRISRARTAPTPPTASRSRCEARTIDSRSPRSVTTFLITPSGMRGMWESTRKPRGETE